MGSIEVPDDRFRYKHVDMVGPVPESYWYKYSFSAFCRTSRWLEVFPMRSVSSEECALAFLQ